MNQQPDQNNYSSINRIINNKIILEIMIVMIMKKFLKIIILSNLS
jgi:hypothetical protein